LSSPGTIPLHSPVGGSSAAADPAHAYDAQAWVSLRPLLDPAHPVDMMCPG